MKNIVIFILLVIVTFSSCYTQTTRIKNLPLNIDSLKADDYLVGDQGSSPYETRKLTVEAIRKGLPTATINAKGLFSAADKKIISKILYSINGSDTNLTVWGDWNFKGLTRFGAAIFTGGATFNSSLQFGDAGSFKLPGRNYTYLDEGELSFDETKKYLIYRYRFGEGMGDTGVDSLASIDWIRSQNYGSGGSGKVDSTIVLQKANEVMADNELAGGYIETESLNGYPILKLFSNIPYIYTGIDSFPSLRYIKEKLASYLNPYQFRRFGSPDSVEIVDSLFKGTVHGLNLSGVNSEIVYYGTNSVALNPTGNKYYLSASAEDIMPYKHQVTFYNVSPTYTVSFTPGLAFKLKNNSTVTLGYHDTIVFDYDGYVWRQIGGSDN